MTDAMRFIIANLSDTVLSIRRTKGRLKRETAIDLASGGVPDVGLVVTTASTGPSNPGVSRGEIALYRLTSANVNFVAAPYDQNGLPV